MVSAWLERYYNMMAKQAEARDDVPDAPVHEDVLGEF
jgi:hypothetical protein